MPDERGGQSAGTGSYFENADVAIVAECQRSDAVGDRAVEKKMLPERSLRPQPPREQLGARVYFRTKTRTGRSPKCIADSYELNPRSIRFPFIAPPVSPASAGP